MQLSAGALASCSLFGALLSCTRPPPILLNPRNVPPGHGAIFGNVRVFEDGTEVTRRCAVAFSDGKNETKLQVHLQGSGWIFTSVTKGITRVSSVNCLAWNGLSYGPMGLVFDAVRGRTTYFGHLSFDLKANPAPGFYNTFSGVTVSSPGGMPRPGREHVWVENKFDDAVRQYLALYGSIGANTLVVALAGSSSTGPSSGSTLGSSSSQEPTPVASPAATCGDGIVGPSESCDGDIPAGATCFTATMGLMRQGTLRCTGACDLDVSGCKP